ncbi:MAG: polyribonucleotide nucleotidyltransferase [Chloroflexota bacterium]
MLETQKFECEVGGRTLAIETGKLAGQADAAVTVRYGDTIVMVTACVSPSQREGVDFLPLTIDYEERLYAAGKIPGGFIRREGRPSEEAILTCRLADRPIRPLLPKTWRNDIQIVATVLSADQENEPDVLAVIGASVALTLSSVPFYGPVGALHIGYIDGQLVINPTLVQLETSQLDLVVASTEKEVVMLEAGAKEVSEDVILQAIKLGHETNQAIIELQKRMQQACGKPKAEMPAVPSITEAVAAISAIADQKIDVAMMEATKAGRERILTEVGKEVAEKLAGQFGEDDIISGFDAAIKARVRKNILESGKRSAGRGLTEIRPIACEVGLLPRTHGSALFTRGQTQVLNIATLGSTRKEQMLDGLGIEESKRFIHHYNMPPYSNGEVKRMGSPGRREVGHGALAERALVPVLPKDEDFPYTIRLVSEVLSSSGSTSMASVCASSLSLMDAGIPIKSAVSGIAMGLVTGENGKFAVLTDIEGLEDAYGDMDFKVAGTSDGVTAVQMDTKLKGLSMEIVEKTMYQAREARLFILDKMMQTIKASRPDVSRYAPRMHKMSIPVEKIGNVIGGGGKTIRAIISETKTTIDINDDGTVIIGSPDAEATRKAIQIIENLTRDVEIGDTFTGKVTRILDFGAMVEILPGKEGLVHISELADYRVGKVEDEVKVGDEVTVKVVGVDNLGRINLSRRAMLENAGTGEGAPPRERPYNPPRRSGPPPGQRPSGGGFRPGGGERRPPFRER